MDRKQPTKGFESIEEAATRLLGRLERGKRPAGEKPAEIQNSAMPLAEKEAGEAAAISASFTGQDLVAANDNGRAAFDSDYPKRMLTATARPAPDDSVRYRSRGIGLLDRRAPGEF